MKRKIFFFYEPLFPLVAKSSFQSTQQSLQVAIHANSVNHFLVPQEALNNVLFFLWVRDSHTDILKSATMFAFLNVSPVDSGLLQMVHEMILVEIN